MSNELLQKIKPQLKKALPNLIYIVAFITIIVIFRPRLPIVIGIIIVSNLSRFLYRSIKRKNKVRAWDITKVIVTPILFMLAFVLLSKILPWFLLIIIMAFIILFGAKPNRQMYMDSLRDVEENIFGKPLDKDKWEKGELKRIKFKVRWKFWGKKHQ